MTDPATKKKGFLNKLSGAAGATSMHGIANIIESKSKFKKILWATFLTVALVGSTWYIQRRSVHKISGEGKRQKRVSGVGANSPKSPKITKKPSVFQGFFHFLLDFQGAGVQAFTPLVTSPPE